MRVLANNCVCEMKVPKRVEEAHTVDYNPVLGLYVTLNAELGRVFVWNPVTGSVVSSFEATCDGFSDALFLPGKRVGVSYSEPNHGGNIEIYSLDSKKKSKRSKQPKLLIERDQLPTTYPGPMALSPKKTLLVADAEYPGEIYEMFIDWDELKVLKSRTIDLSTGEDVEELYGASIFSISHLCCLPDFTVIVYEVGERCIIVTKVRSISEDEVESEVLQTITYYVLHGEKRELKMVSDADKLVSGVVHDGEHLIIAHGDEIVLLESMTEGSTAHLIADTKAKGRCGTGLGVNDEGQLIVCEDTVIKLFEYSCSPRSLMSLCRNKIRKSTPNYAVRVNKFAIPQILKEYLLYK